MILQTGTILNKRYRIVELLRQGGFGAVYRAWDIALERHCAIKDNLDAAPETQKQFEREAKILANLSHPNLPGVSDHFIIPGQGQYLAMDLVEGKDLQTMIEDRGAPFPEAQVLTWIEQVCDALTYMHSQNPAIIHRDIKPANIQITPSGQAILVDFGIAKVYDPGLKTTLGARAVTPGYSPYEQYGQGSTDRRTDIYALGATIYTLLTGLEPPESVQRVVRDPLVPLRKANPSLSSGAAAALKRALEMDPEDRFQSVSSFKDALLTGSEEPIIPGDKKPVSIPQPWSWLVLIGALLVILTLAVLIQKNRVQNAAREVTPAALLASATSNLNKTQNPPKTPTNRPTISTAVPIPQPTPFVYTVQAGDICGTIASAFNITVDSIISLNHLTADCTILEGQILLLKPLVLPVGASTTITPTVTAPPPGARQAAPVDGMEMVYIPAGVFKMGASDSDSEARGDEKPQNWVYLDEFWIDLTEVTNAMYARCVAVDICNPPAQSKSKTRIGYFTDNRYADYPVIYVSWFEATNYCAWAGRRLPGEAEWEKAARGIYGGLYPWGDTPPNSSLLNFNNQIGDTTPVGSYPLGASPYGVLDMAGNVREWLSDRYGDHYYAIMPVANPTGPANGDFNILRGGSWFSPASAVRAASRLWNYPDLVYDSSGFRCAKTP